MFCNPILASALRSLFKSRVLFDNNIYNSFSLIPKLFRLLHKIVMLKQSLASPCIISLHATCIKSYAHLNDTRFFLTLSNHFVLRFILSCVVSIIGIWPLVVLSQYKAKSVTGQCDRAARKKGEQPELLTLYLNYKFLNRTSVPTSLNYIYNIYLYFKF